MTREEEAVILNNDRDPMPPSTIDPGGTSAHMPITTASSPLLAAPNNIRIQNDTTKDINKISPQNSFRRQLATRRLSVLINNTQQQLQLQQQQQLLEQFTRKNSLKNLPAGNVNYRRRMSSFEHTYEKASNLNLYSVENMNNSGSIDLHTSKLNLAGEVLSAVVGGSRKCSTTESIIASAGSNVHINNNNHNNQHENDCPSAMKKQTISKHLQRWCTFFDVQEFVTEREEYSLYVFSPENR